MRTDTAPTENTTQQTPLADQNMNICLALAFILPYAPPPWMPTYLAFMTMLAINPCDQCVYVHKRVRIGCSRALYKCST